MGTISYPIPQGNSRGTRLPPQVWLFNIRALTWRLHGGQRFRSNDQGEERGHIRSGGVQWGRRVYRWGDAEVGGQEVRGDWKGETVELSTRGWLNRYGRRGSGSGPGPFCWTEERIQRRRPKKNRNLWPHTFSIFFPLCHDRKHMTGTHNHNCKQMPLLLNWKVKEKVCLRYHVWAEGTEKMEYVCPPGLQNISRLTRDSGARTPAFDSVVMMHRRDRAEENCTGILRHNSSSNQTRGQEQTDGFIWCVTADFS